MKTANCDLSASTELLARFSNLLWQVNRVAQENSLSDFYPETLEIVQNLISFDCAWWGRSALVEGRIEEHSRYFYKLPESYFTDWRSIEHQDVTVGKAYRVPGESVIVDMQNATPGLEWLANKHNLGELLCVLYTNPRTQLSDHVSLYRRPGRARFGLQDRFLLTNLICHLSSALDVAQVRTLVACRENLDSRQMHLALAVCDRHGTLHGAERSFSNLLNEEWPDWTGPRLPIDVGAPGYRGRNIRIHCVPILDLWLLTIYRICPLDALTERELSVARKFSEGLTYKEIARALSIAPSTVRHHLRNSYLKLDVHDKASMAKLISSSVQPATSAVAQSP